MRIGVIRLFRDISLIFLRRRGVLLGTERRLSLGQKLLRGFGFGIVNTRATFADRLRTNEYGSEKKNQRAAGQPSRVDVTGHFED